MDSSPTLDSGQLAFSPLQWFVTAFTCLCVPGLPRSPAFFTLPFSGSSHPSPPLISSLLETPGVQSSIVHGFIDLFIHSHIDIEHLLYTRSCS